MLTLHLELNNKEAGMMNWILTDRKKLEEYLKQYYVGFQPIANVMLLAYDIGLIDDVRNQKRIDNTWIVQMCQKINDMYGFREEIAESAIKGWISLLYGLKADILESLIIDTSCLVDCILSDPMKTVKYTCRDYMKETKIAPSAFLCEAGYVFSLGETVILDVHNKEYYFEIYNLFLNDSTISTCSNCYYIENAEQENELQFCLTDDQSNRLRGLYPQKDVFHDSNIDSYVRKSHELLTEIARTIENKKIRWSKEAYDGKGYISLEERIWIKDLVLFDDNKYDSKQCILVLYAEDSYLVHLLITNTVRQYYDECIRIFFKIWGLDSHCLDVLNETRSKAVSNEELYDKEFAVLRRCDTKTQFVEESTLYFPNDYQAEECWDQCKTALWYDGNDLDSDELEYTVQFLDEYYYSMFLDRDDEDEEIYYEYDSRASSIFQEMHCYKMREWFIRKALEYISCCTKKEEYVNETSYWNSEEMDTLFFFPSSKSAEKFWDLCQSALVCDEYSFILSYLKDFYYIQYLLS